MTGVVVSNPLGVAVFAVAVLLGPLVLVVLAHMEGRNR